MVLLCMYSFDGNILCHKNHVTITLSEEVSYIMDRSLWLYSRPVQPQASCTLPLAALRNPRVRFPGSGKLCSHFLGIQLAASGNVARDLLRADSIMRCWESSRKTVPSLEAEFACNIVPLAALPSIILNSSVTSKVLQSFPPRDAAAIFSRSVCRPLARRPLNPNFPRKPAGEESQGLSLRLLGERSVLKS